MAPANHNSVDERLKSFVERIELLDEDRREMGADIKEVYAEAKDAGYDPKIMRQVIRLRRMDKDDLAEQEAMLDVYKHALGMLVETPLGQAALDAFERKTATRDDEPPKRGPGRPRKQPSTEPQANGSDEPAREYIERVAGVPGIGNNLSARYEGRQDALSGTREHAHHWPHGSLGHAEYEWGFQEFAGGQLPDAVKGRAC